MREKSCLVLGVVTALFLASLLICLGLLAIRPDRGYNGIYAGVKIGASEKSVRVRYAPLKPRYVHEYPAGQDNYHPISPDAVTCLLVIDRNGWHYVFYLDAHGRVVQKRRYFD
ncbi:MAG: hypothetical protein Q7T82_08355 [Armatimonadota bacterium]|nr:hypothetical protein [Armatimonadota bacterium]